MDELLTQFLAASGLKETPTADGAAAMPNAPFMASLRDPLKVSYRPLFFYLLMETVALSAHLRLLRNGFRLCKVSAYCAFFQSEGPQAAAAAASSVPPTAPAGQGSSSGAPLSPLQPSAVPLSVAATAFLAVAAAASAAAEAAAHLAAAATELPLPAPGMQADGGDADVPIIFLHGIGAGLAPYVGFLRRMAVGGQRVYGVQYKHVSMRLTSAIPSPPEVADDVLAFMNERGIAKAKVSHEGFLCSGVRDSLGFP